MLEGIKINKFEWEEKEILLLEEAIKDWKKGLNWNGGVFNKVFGKNNNYIYFKRKNKDKESNVSARTLLRDDGEIMVILYDRCFNGCDGLFPDINFYIKGTIVHELAHVWDIIRGLTLSREMMELTGSYYVEKNGNIEYRPKGDGKYNGTTKNGHVSHFDDFAESISTYIYGNSYDNNQGQFVDQKRRDFVWKVAKSEVIRYGCKGT